MPDELGLRAFVRALLGVFVFLLLLWLILSFGLSGWKTLAGKCGAHWGIERFGIATDLFCHRGS